MDYNILITTYVSSYVSGTTCFALSSRKALQNKKIEELYFNNREIYTKLYSNVLNSYTHNGQGSIEFVGKLDHEFDDDSIFRKITSNDEIFRHIY